MGEKLQPDIAHLLTQRRCAQVGVIGEAADLTYDYTHLGSAAKDIAKAAKAPFLAAMAKAKRPMIVVGPGVMRRADSKAVMKDILSLATSAGALLSPFCFWHPGYVDDLGLYRVCLYQALLSSRGSPRDQVASHSRCAALPLLRLCFLCCIHDVAVVTSSERCFLSLAMSAVLALFLLPTLQAVWLDRVPAPCLR